MSDALTLRGQRVVLIGGASGIGRAVAEAAIADGAAVVVASSDPAKVEAAAARLGDGARGEIVDVKDEASVAALFERRPAGVSATAGRASASSLRRSRRRR
jgi:NAD(P)-dependent dehydrogenase (short-subunit alcohol dehydrogenase family)